MALRTVDEGHSVTSPPDHTSHDRLLMRVRTAFPQLDIADWHVDQTGGDHLLLIVNGTHAFRFPREGMHDLRLEIEVIRRLQPKTAIAIPAYDHVDPAGRFAGYRFIEGAALSATRYMKLPPSGRAALLRGLAQFLADLHDLPTAWADWSQDLPLSWTAAQFAERGLSERLPLIARLAPRLAKPVAAFYHAYRYDRPDRSVIVHGDLVCDHILMDSRTDRLAGIIDFGDVALGDPAQDFLGVWSYGREALSDAVRFYDPCHPNPDLLHRSRNHFIRYRLDGLFESLTEASTSEKSTARLTEMEDLLARPDLP